MTHPVPPANPGNPSQPIAATGLGTSLCIGLSETGFTLLRGDGLWKSRYQVLAQYQLDEGKFNHETLTIALTQQLEQAGAQKLPITLILADDWARYFLVTPPRNINSLGDCQAAANLRFTSLYGEAAIDWQINAHWDTQQTFLACALPHTLLNLIKQVVARQKSTLIGIIPQFIANWNRWAKLLNGNAWYAQVHGEQLTLAAMEKGRLCALRHTRCNPVQWEDQTWLPAYLQREALRLGLSMPTELQLCGDIPVNWAKHSMGQLECWRLDAGQTHLQQLAQENGSQIITHELRLAALGARL
jgi:hypothetical protein